MTAAVAAAIIIRKEQELIAHFRAAGATTPATAKSLAALGLEDQMILHKLRRRAVIRESGAGAFYLDEATWTARQQERRRVMGLMVVGLVALGIALMLIITAKQP